MMMIHNGEKLRKALGQQVAAQLDELSKYAMLANES